MTARKPLVVVNGQTRQLAAADSLDAGLAWGKLTDKPTTLAGYGITDAVPLVGGYMSGNLGVATYTRIGLHPTYGWQYSGLWRVNDAQTADLDYAVLFDPLNTFISSRGAGALYFQHDGQGRAMIDATGLHVYGTGSTIAGEAWQSVSLQNGWWPLNTSVYNDAGYWKDALGIVHLRGMLYNGSLSMPIFTLPSGYRPMRVEVMCVQTYSGAGSVYVRNDGAVLLASGSNSWVSLDGITFRAYQ